MDLLFDCSKSINIEFQKNVIESQNINSVNKLWFNKYKPQIRII